MYFAFKCCEDASEQATFFGPYTTADEAAETAYAEMSETNKVGIIGPLPVKWINYGEVQ